MIIENPFESNKKTTQKYSKDYTAKVSNRFYAFIVDNICINQPIAYFISAPIIALLKKNSFYDLGYLDSVFLQLIIVIYFTVAIFVSTASTFLLSATPGQKLFGLKVIADDHKPLSLWSSFVRSFLMYMQSIFMFISLLNIFSTNQGLHEKISDTHMVSTAPSVFKPILKASTLRSFYVSIALLFLFMFSNTVSNLISTTKGPELAGATCQSIESLNLNKAVKVWDDKLVPPLLYLLNKNNRISDGCFKEHINSYISVNKNEYGGYFYLWLKSNDSIVKNKYQKKLCSSNNPYCDLVNQKLTVKNNKNFSNLNYKEMAGIIFLLNRSEDILDWKSIIDLDGGTSVLSWLPILRDKVYFLVNSGLLRNDFKSYISPSYVKDNTSKDIYELASVDACFSNLINSCDYESEYCENFKSYALNKYELNIYDQVNLGLLSYCDKSYKPQLRGWDKEKYITVFFDFLSNKKKNKLVKIINSKYAHPRLKMASLSMMVKEEYKINNIKSYLSRFKMNFDFNKTNRLPASVSKEGVSE